MNRQVSGRPCTSNRDCDEAFYVLAGEYHIFIGEDEHLSPAGSFVFIPQDTVHGFASVMSPAAN